VFVIHTSATLGSISSEIRWSEQIGPEACQQCEPEILIGAREKALERARAIAMERGLSIVYVRDDAVSVADLGRQAETSAPP
jgi:Pyruvate/2-oxoacid:ferredoxin oxidoreductase gamma subunit